MGVFDFVVIEISVDNDTTWTEISPPNVANTGTFTWSVPNIDSVECSMRVTNMCDIAATSVSTSHFTIEPCLLEGDVTGDCFVDLDDFFILASQWLM